MIRGLVLSAIMLLGVLTKAMAAADEPVTVTASNTEITVNNGIVSLDLGRATGNLDALRYGGKSLLAEPAYLDWIVAKNNHLNQPAFNVVADPKYNGGTMAEVSFAQKSSTASPFDVELHYVLRRGDAGPYCFAVFTHHASDPASGIGQSRFVMRLDDGVFDFINVDPARRFVMAPANTPTKILGPKESMMFTSGRFQGQITDKYHFYVDSGDHFLHGWSGTKSLLGCWVVTGSNESQNGGPTKQHNDAQWARLLFKILVCGHYGATGVHVAADENWQKIYGPWMIYLNHAPNNDALWADAQHKTAELRAAWPYDWMHHPAYPLAAERGSARGRLLLIDPQDRSATPVNAWVGLAAPSPDWQQQSDGYQFWAHADKDGRFQIPQVRSGKYTLYAFTNGVMDQFRRDDITITAGKTTDLGEMKWTPLRFGKQVWQIGTPDRTAAEFRHGDDFRHWGLWQDFPKDFPNGVNFVIGKSVERTDWNYAQVNIEKDAKWTPATWKIDFEQPAPTTGTGILRLAMASTHNAKMSIELNGRSIDSFHAPADNAMIRAGIHGQYSEQDTFFDASQLVVGKNTISLTQNAAENVQKSVMYDALRLEIDDSRSYQPSLAKAHPHQFPQSGAESTDE